MRKDGQCVIYVLCAALLFFMLHASLPVCHAASYQNLTGKDKLVAEEYLYYAKMSYKAKDYLIAEAYCQKLIAAYPDTKYAAEARKILKSVEHKRRGGLIWLGD